MHFNCIFWFIFEDLLLFARAFDKLHIFNFQREIFIGYSVMIVIMHFNCIFWFIFEDLLLFARAFDKLHIFNFQREIFIGYSVMIVIDETIKILARSHSSLRLPMLFWI